MALTNRDKDVSEQRECFMAVLNATPSGISAGILNPGLSTGTTFRVCTIPYPATLVAIEESVWGLSGSPSHNYWIYRFAGGFTSILCGGSFAVTAFGTSGPLTWSGSSLGTGTTFLAGTAATFPLLAGDQIVLYALGSNAAVAEANVTVVVKALQDIKSHFAQ